MPDTLNVHARRLGLAGLIIPIACAGAVLVDRSLRWIMLAAGFGYAAFIFSFLGGVWWGLGMGHRAAPAWIWIAAVSPSLMSLILFMPWVFGWEWPRPALVILGVMICLSPLVDRAIGYTILLPTGWLRLRFQLSAGLGLITILMASL